MPSTPVIAFPAISDDAFASMLNDRSPMLRAFARRLTKSDIDAEDLAQETMLRCWSARDGFEPGTNFAAWSRTVMRNRFLSDRQRAQRQVSLPDEAFDRMEGSAGGQDGAVALSEVVRAIAELSEEQREAVLLSGQGASIRDGAHHLSISEASFKSRVSRGRSRLRELVERGRTSAQENPLPAPVRPALIRRKPRYQPGMMIG